MRNVMSSETLHDDLAMLECLGCARCEDCEMVEWQGNLYCDKCPMAPVESMEE